MTMLEISQRLELHFWDWLIARLSASRPLQKFLFVLYQGCQAVWRFRWVIAGAVVAGVGYLNGVAVFQLTAALLK